MEGSFPPEIAEILTQSSHRLPLALYQQVEGALSDAIRVSREYRNELKRGQDEQAKLLNECTKLRTDRTRDREERDQAVKERNLYRALLTADEQPAIRPYLDGVLDALIAKTGAQKAIIILFSTPGEYRRDYAELVRYNYNEKDLEAFKDQIELSQGIVRQAISTRSTIYTEEAITDSRFSEHASVRLLRLKTVLCSPLLGAENKFLGVLYLEHRGRKDAFPESEQKLIEMVVGQMARWVARHTIVARAHEAFDHTTPYRERYGYKEIVGKSEAIAEVLRLITVSLEVNLKTPILITGEPGTGKNLIARALHFNGEWARGPWVELDCTSYAADQIDRILFGYAKGAFDGADRHQPGKFEAADDGTLFIDHISSLPLPTQDRLLKVLQERAIVRLGDHTTRPINVRVIAASQKSLKTLVEQGTFREELLFRLNVFPIHIPPVRERREDIPVLAEYFVDMCNQLATTPLTLSPDAVSFLKQCDFAGNVRELKERLTRAAMHATNGVIESSLLSSIGQIMNAGQAQKETPPLTWKDAIATFQRQLLIDTLKRTNRNLQETAELLGISRQHLSRLLHELDLNDHRPSHRGRKSQSNHAK